MEHKFSQILRYMGISKEQIHMEASFKKDFEFNEFQFSCLVHYIEIYFNINIFPEDYASLETIGNAICFVKKRVENA